MPAPNENEPRAECQCLDPRCCATKSVPAAGKILADLGRGASYALARRGGIVTVDIGSRRKRVSTAWIREQLGLDPWPSDVAA